MTNLKLGSLFDGSGGFPLGGVMAGITPVWASEVEPFAVRVTTKRFPFMKHYGDISAMDGGKIEPVDIITFGSPCQDMSVAGKRDGLDGKRSGLFYEAVRIIKEMRRATNGKYPRWICWENVPGAFSSNNGYDFKAVLEAVIGIAEEGAEVPMPEKTGWPYADVYLGDGWSVAYRTLDAQYWGVPQRRRRIYLVADFAGRSAGDVLFKSEGVSGYSAESFRAWQRAANGAEDSTGAPGFGLDGYNGSVSDKAATLGVNCGMSTGRNGVVLNDQGGNRMDITDDVTCTLRAEAHHPPCVLDTLAIENHPNDGRVKIEDDGKVQTLSSRMGTGGNNVPLVMKIRSGCEGGGKGALIQTDKSATFAYSNDQTLFVPSNWDGGQISPTLTKQNAGGNQRMPDKDNFNCVLQPFGICSKDSNSMKSSNPHSGIYEADTSRTLDANGGNPACNQGGIAIVCVDQPEAVTKSETIVIEGNGTRPSHKGDGYKKSDVMYTLNTIDRHAVYAMTTGGFTQVEKDCSPTLMARDYKDPNAIYCGEKTPYGFDPSCARDLGQYFLEDCGNTLVNGTCPGHHNGVLDTSYTVRRLTPTECARLQGFPDWWCSGLEERYPAIQDIRFWQEVWDTYARVIGGCKPKTEKQVRKWLEHPHSDSAEYKLWGNGVALPCVFFILSGIVYYTQDDGE